MKVAILETIFSPGGHEVEFDRVLVDALKAAGHTPVFFVPEKYPFKMDYGCDIVYLDGGSAITYNTSNFFKKLILSVQREYRRRKWFTSAFENLKRDIYGAVIIPTSTSRYVRAILGSKLCKAIIPVNLIVHGVNPGEFKRYRQAARNLECVKNVRFKILSLRHDFDDVPNIDEIHPAVIAPKDFVVPEKVVRHEPMRLGFFGQYRRDKKMRFFLEAFKQAKFARPVEFWMQCVTSKNEDQDELNKSIYDYEGVPGIKLIKRPFFGDEWRKALESIDVMMVPAGLGDNSRYHWGGVFFNALGSFKPMLADERINPEIFAQYNVGEGFNSENLPRFVKQLERFVNEFDKNCEKYEVDLRRVCCDFSSEKLVQNILREG